MIRKTEIIKKLKALVLSVLLNQDIQLADDQKLIGEDSILDSMKLVELCLLLEDYSFTLGFEFDLVSEKAMSNSRSMFLSVNSLADEFYNQMVKSK